MTEWKHCPLCAAPLASRVVEGDRERLACTACDFIRYDNPVPVVAAIVVHDGEVILARNVGWPEKMYGLVTGFLERNERPEDGIRRELKEELGLDATSVDFIGLYTFELLNQLIIAYEVRATGPVTVGPELAGIKRVPIAKLRPWPSGTGEALADWLSRRPTTP